MNNVNIEPVWHKVTSDDDLPIDIDDHVLLIVKTSNGHIHLNTGECVSKKELGHLCSQFLEKDNSKYVFERTFDVYETKYILVSNVLYWSYFDILLECPDDVTDGYFDDDHTFYTDCCIFADRVM